MEPTETPQRTSAHFVTEIVRLVLLGQMLPALLAQIRHISSFKIDAY